jgi:hypothetical protein
MQINRCTSALFSASRHILVAWLTKGTTCCCPRRHAAASYFSVKLLNPGHFSGA